MDNSQDKHIGLTEAENILRSRRNGRDKLYKTENGKMVVDHSRAATTLALFISNIPMDKWIKRVMLMRIGSPLLNRKQMSHMTIALKIGATMDEVIEMEKIGIEICNEYMQKISVEQGSHSLENKILINDTLNETIDK